MGKTTAAEFLQRIEALRRRVRWGEKQNLLELSSAHDIESMKEARTCSTPACLAGWGMSLSQFKHWCKRNGRTCTWDSLGVWLTGKEHAILGLFAGRRDHGVSQIEEVEHRLDRVAKWVKRYRK